MTEAVILDAIRTPMGRHGGILRDIRPDDLAAHLIKTLIARNKMDPADIVDVYLGCANQAGEDCRNVARIASLLAGLPYTVSGVTVNRLCASGLEAINQAGRAVQTNNGELFIAGGVESMTRSPWVIGKSAIPYPRGSPEIYDSALGWRFPNPHMEMLYSLAALGDTAENVADQYKIGRQEQDYFALESHQRAVRANEQGIFKDEIVPVNVPQARGGYVTFEKDEGPRPDTSLEKLAALKPSFKPEGTVTPGNSSPLSDGAAVLLVAGAEKAASLGIKPLARIVASAVAGVHPSYMGMGPVPATQLALKKAGLSISDIDQVEINEAFASQSLACIQELGLDRNRVNGNGGAIALGHPLGCSGARIMTTLIYEMRRRGVRYGLATLCVGVGQGVTTIVEAV